MNFNSNFDIHYSLFNIRYSNIATAQEMNNDYFTVERSKDGVDFEKVVIVKGAGNSSAKLNYAE